MYMYILLKKVDSTSIPHSDIYVYMYVWRNTNTGGHFCRNQMCPRCWLHMIEHLALKRILWHSRSQPRGRWPIFQLMFIHYAYISSILVELWVDYTSCIAVLCPFLETIEPLDDSDVIIETLEPPGDNTPRDTYHDVKDYYYNSDSYNNAGTTRHPNSSASINCNNYRQHCVRTLISIIKFRAFIQHWLILFQSSTSRQAPLHLLSPARSRLVCFYWLLRVQNWWR